MRNAQRHNLQVDWDDYRVFSAVAEVGSVRAAAQRLGMHPSTVSRRLDHLEQRLGVRLFTRTRSGLLITEDGSEVVQALGRVVVELGEIERRLRGPDSAMVGDIRVTLPAVFAGNLLMEDFARFVAEHAAVRLVLLASDRTLDLDRREADVAIRVTDSPPENLVGRRLGSYNVLAYASSRYLAVHDPVGSPEACAWIESVLDTGSEPSFKSAYFSAMPPGTRCNGVLLQLAAARAHMGVAALPCILGDADPMLVRVGGIEPTHAQDIWLLSHPDLRRVTRVQALSEFLVGCFRNLEGALLGRRAPADSTSAQGNHHS